MSLYNYGYIPTNLSSTPLNLLSLLELDFSSLLFCCLWNESKLPMEGNVGIFEVIEVEGVVLYNLVTCDLDDMDNVRESEVCDLNVFMDLLLATDLRLSIV